MSKKNFVAQQEIAPKSDPIVVGAATQPVELVNPTSVTSVRRSAYDLALIAIFSAIGIVLNLQTATFPRIDFFGRMSFVYCYCMVCGIMLGPMRGGFCAAASDMLIAILVPEGGQIFMPLITISNLLMAVIPGTFYHYILPTKPNLALILSAAACFLVCTLGLSALGETLLYKYFGSAPFYPSVTALVAPTGMPVYLAFVIRKSLTQPFWIIFNLVLSKLLLSAPAVRKYITAPKRPRK